MRLVGISPIIYPNPSLNMACRCTWKAYNSHELNKRFNMATYSVISKSTFLHARMEWMGCACVTPCKAVLLCWLLSLVSCNYRITIELGLGLGAVICDCG
jgi:hypothetical protein